ncbi:MAG: dTDP-4-amino-4,6-dideoxygalactose transaminase [Armatimonadetes bacterium]|nr:dTDP-4-amino-4,6-dideoxygalactose transaminase [Armatimonadota bacterium]
MPTDVKTLTKIPFNKPYLTGKESDLLIQLYDRGHFSGDGEFTKRCNELISYHTGGANKVLLTTSCTHALEMTALLLELKPGDEVIMPSFTFVSTANAYVLRGANIVFGDIRPDTLNLNEKQLTSLITPKTKAIVVVHYAGVGCEMDEITAIADRNGIKVIEDNAHGLFGSYKGRPLGSFGAIATQSFHETKNIQCGEGGALVLNDESYFDRAEIIREKGTNRSQFFRGQVDKYRWVDEGSSYLPSDILAAFLFAQLQEWEKIQARREHIWSTYWNELEDWANENSFKRPYSPEHCAQPYHMFYMLAPNLETRTRFIQHMRDRDILTVFHYVPLHNSPMGEKVGRGMCPVTENISDRLVRLPLYNDLSQSDLLRVVEAIRSFKA